MTPPECPFDTVVVRDGAVRRELTLDAFLRLPLPQRIGYILGRTLEFHVRGRPVDRAEALRWLTAFRARADAGAAAGRS